MPSRGPARGGSHATCPSAPADHQMMAAVITRRDAISPCSVQNYVVEPWPNRGAMAVFWCPPFLTAASVLTSPVVSGRWPARGLRAACVAMEVGPGDGLGDVVDVEATLEPPSDALLDDIASVLVRSDAKGEIHSAEDQAFVDALIDSVHAGREEQLGYLAKDRVGLLLSPRYASIVRRRLKTMRSERDRAALLTVNEFVVSLANSTEQTLSSLHQQQMQKVEAMCLAARRGGTVALHELALELHEAGKLDADFVNWLDLGIRAAEASDGGAPSQWQLVLRLIQRGVHAILEEDYRADVETLRTVMSVPAPARRDLVWTLLEDMDTDSAQHFAATLERIRGSLAYEPDVNGKNLLAEVGAIRDAVEAWFATPARRKPC